MKAINVKFTGIKVTGFNAQHGSLTLEIGFNDGVEKQLSRTTLIDNPEQLANSIVNEIYHLEKTIHSGFNERDILKSHVDIVVRNEDAVVRELTRFLMKADERVRIILKAKLADGYLNKIKELNRMSLEF